MDKVTYGCLLTLIIGGSILFYYVADFLESNPWTARFMAGAKLVVIIGCVVGIALSTLLFFVSRRYGGEISWGLEEIMAKKIPLMVKKIFKKKRPRRDEA